MTFATILRNYDFRDFPLSRSNTGKSKSATQRVRFIGAKAIFNYSKIANYSNSNMLTTTVFVTGPGVLSPSLRPRGYLRPPRSPCRAPSKLEAPSPPSSTFPLRKRNDFSARLGTTFFGK
ncbi:hypothetical protein TNCV_3958031 [Trichonephila clavipes]|nr:hypothetical protein TNCV_3958031 [Trichonephila clavipes]